MQNNLSNTHQQKQQGQVQQTKENVNISNPKYNKNYTKQQISLIFSYLNGSSYFQDLKKQNSFIHWMSFDQKRKLLNSSYFYLAKKQVPNQIKELIKQAKRQLKNTQTIKIVVIVLYGKLYVGKNIFYSGQWVVLSQNQLHKIQEQKCVCLMFQKNIFEKQIQALNRFHYRKNRFKTFFLDKAGLQIPSKKIDQIVEQIQFFTNSQKFTLINSKQKRPSSGIFILNKGYFNVIDIKTKVNVGQISQNYFGQESLWTNFKYNLKSKQNDSELLFCSQQILQNILEPLKYIEIIRKLKELFQQKVQMREKVNQQIIKLVDGAKIQRDRIKKKVKLKINQEQLNQTLILLKQNKPGWQIEEEQTKKHIKNLRKNIFTEPSQSQSPRKKYFSVKIKSNQTALENRIILKKHFSQQKFKKNIQQIKKPLKSLQQKLQSQIFDLSSATVNNFSKFARTTYVTKQKIMSQAFQFKTPKKSTSESKITKTNYDSFQNKIDDWDVEYSKRYDRVLSASIRKSKHLNLVFQLKNKIFPKEKGQFFTMKDSNQAIKFTFYQLEKLRRIETDQKNKRSFQKVFKQKMLLATSMSNHPKTTR